MVLLSSSSSMKNIGRCCSSSRVLVCSTTSRTTSSRLQPGLGQHYYSTWFPTSSSSCTTAITTRKSFVHGKDDTFSKITSRKGTTRTITTTSVVFRSTFTFTSQLRQQQKQPTCCYFSSSSSVKDKDEGKVLYKRSEGRSWRPRFLSAFGVMHTAYWSWYNYDYIPALSEKGIEVSKYFGLLGLGTGFFMMGLSVIYPLHLITEIRELPSKAIQIKTFTLPFIIPSQDGMTWSRGSVTMVNPVDRKLVLEQGGGAISKYEGHLSLKKPDSTRFFYLLHPHPTEVMDDVALANLLLDTDITKLNNVSNEKEGQTKHSSPPSRRRRGYASPRSNRAATATSATTRRVIRKPQQKTD